MEILWAHESSKWDVVQRYWHLNAQAEVESQQIVKA